MYFKYLNYFKFEIHVNTCILYFISNTFCYSIFSKIISYKICLF